MRGDTTLTVAQLGEGVRKYTVRPVARSQFAPVTAAALAVAALSALAAAVHAAAIAAVLIASVFMLRWAFSVEEESLLVIGGMGLQICTR